MTGLVDFVAKIAAVRIRITRVDHTRVPHPCGLFKDGFSPRAPDLDDAAKGSITSAVVWLLSQISPPCPRCMLFARRLLADSFRTTPRKNRERKTDSTAFSDCLLIYWHYTTEVIKNGLRVV